MPLDGNGSFVSSGFPAEPKGRLQAAWDPNPFLREAALPALLAEGCTLKGLMMYSNKL